VASAGLDPSTPVDDPGSTALSAELREDYRECLEAMCDDLNTSVALAKAVEGAKAVLRSPALGPGDAAAAAWFLQRVNSLLGVVRHDTPVEAEVGSHAPAELDGRTIEEWVEERTAAKAARDFALADSIRDRLAAAGIELRDTPDGVEWSLRR
jgi:cysteinyl-tRNA synthetase